MRCSRSGETGVFINTSHGSTTTELLCFCLVTYKSCSLLSGLKNVQTTITTIFNKQINLRKQFLLFTVSVQNENFFKEPWLRSVHVTLLFLNIHFAPCFGLYIHRPLKPHSPVSMAVDAQQRWILSQNIVTVAAMAADRYTKEVWVVILNLVPSVSTEWLKKWSPLH